MRARILALAISLGAGIRITIRRRATRAATRIREIPRLHLLANTKFAEVPDNYPLAFVQTRNNLDPRAIRLPQPHVLLVNTVLCIDNKHRTVLPALSHRF